MTLYLLGIEREIKLMERVADLNIVFLNRISVD